MSQNLLSQNDVLVFMYVPVCSFEVGFCRQQITIDIILPFLYREHIILKKPLTAVSSSPHLFKAPGIASNLCGHDGTTEPWAISEWCFFARQRDGDWITSPRR